MPEYIAREELIGRCVRQQKYAWNKCVAPVSWETAYEQFETDVSNAPAADVAQVVHGRWIYKGASVDGKRVYECSACHNDIYATGPYCKECGCKMDKEDDT